MNSTPFNLSFEKEQIIENPDGTMSIALSDEQEESIWNHYEMKRLCERFEDAFSDYWLEYASDNDYLMGGCDDVPELSEDVLTSLVQEAIDYRLECNGECADEYENAGISIWDAFTDTLINRLGNIDLNAEINKIGNQVASAARDDGDEDYDEDEYDEYVRETVRSRVQEAVNTLWIHGKVAA